MLPAEAPWRVRDFHADDLDAAVRLWDNPAASSEAPAFGLSDLIAAVRSHEPAVVAAARNEHGEELAGIAVATVSGGRAWVMRISLAAAWRHRGIGSAMLGELERRKEEVTTADVLLGIAETRRTLTAEVVTEFEQDIQAYARV